MVALVGGLVEGTALLHGDLNFESLSQVCCLLSFLLTRTHPDALLHLCCVGETEGVSRCHNLGFLFICASRRVFFRVEREDTIPSWRKSLSLLLEFHLGE